MNSQLPDPRLTKVYRWRPRLGQPLDLGEIAQGHRRIVPLTGGTFTGPEINGTLAPGRQRRLADRPARRHRARRHPLHAADRRRRSALRPIARCAARQPPKCSHVSARGEDVDASEYTFRTSTQIETGGRRSRLAEQGRLHQRRRPPARRRDLRDLPRRMSAYDGRRRRSRSSPAPSRGIGAGLADALPSVPGTRSWAPRARCRPPTIPTSSRCRATSQTPRPPSASWSRRSIGSGGSTA